MSDHPILFSSLMVRALLDGRKTQTRRVVKPQPPSGHVYVGRVLCSTHRADEGKWTWALEQAAILRDAHRVRCPYGQPGDLLWVREAWTTHKAFDHIAGSKLTTRSIGYPADGKIETGRYRHARFMPRWASRLTLRITDVRVQRLNEISRADAIAEGLHHVSDGCAPWGVKGLAGSWSGDPRLSFAALWESINGPGSWDTNPWVWALTFDVIPRNIDQVKP